MVFHQSSSKSSMVGGKQSIPVSTGAKLILVLADWVPNIISDKYNHNSVIFLVCFIQKYSPVHCISTNLVQKSFQSIRFFFITSAFSLPF